MNNLSNKKNVCFFLFGLGKLAGTERATLGVVNSLCDSYNIYIYSNVSREDVHYFLDERVNLINLNVENVKRDYFKLLNVLLNSLKYHKIDIFVCVESLSFLYLNPILTFFNFGKRNKMKIVVWEHFNFTVNLGLKSRDLARRLALKRSDAVVVLTARDRELWMQNPRVSAKIVNISNPSPFAISVNAYARNSKQIIAIGRYTFQKGFDKLIAIWEDFVKKYNCLDWDLKIIGEGEDKESLQNQINKSGLKNIKLVPSTNNIGEYYKTSSFLVMTSRFEGLPMTLIEAQSYGLPIIAYDCLTGPAEVINRDNGFLVKDDDSEAFSVALNTLISDEALRVSFSNESKSNAEKFLPQEIAKKWIGFLNDL